MTQKNVIIAKYSKKKTNLTGSSNLLGYAITLAVSACQSTKKNTFKVTHMIGTWQMSQKEKM
jgi:hypothetical protein